MIISDAIVIGFQDQIKQKVTGFAAHIEVTKAKSTFAYENEPISISPQFIKSVKFMPEVAHIQVFATKPGLIKTRSSIEGVVVKGITKDFDWNYFKDKFIAGGPINFADPSYSKDIIISKYYADKLDLQLGDTVDVGFVTEPIRIRRFFVKGIYNTGVEELDRTFALADIRNIIQVNKWNDNQVGGYEIFVKNFDKTEEVNNKIRYMTDISEDAQTIQKRYPQIFDWLNLLNTNVVVILIIMIIVAIINMVTSLIIMILERTQMVGIFKALGATNWRMQKIFVINSMQMILYGIVLGDVLSIGLMLLQRHTHLLKLSEEAYYVSEVPVYFSWTHILLINIGAFVVCSIAMLLPSLFVSRIRPVRAIRFE